MKTSEVAYTLSAIQIALIAPITNRARLNRILAAIRSRQCFRCRTEWRRGGNRQGSALCQKCYDLE